MVCVDPVTVLALMAFYNVNVPSKSGADAKAGPIRHTLFLFLLFLLFCFEDVKEGNALLKLFSLLQECISSV